MNQTVPFIDSGDTVVVAEVCESGTELIADGTCQVCARGSYRTQGVEPNCVSCPMGYTTPAERSLTIDDCSIRTYCSLACVLLLS